MKNHVLQQNHYLPVDLKRQIGAFVDHYSNRRHHQSPSNLIPEDANHGRSARLLQMGEQIKKHKLRKRRLHHQAAAAPT